MSQPPRLRQPGRNEAGSCRQHQGGD
ncbi:hypothetical protein GBAR_LOCUS28854 [Geodia barretti]|uniref:Uncharacterized protein n=1 Tax=Geodia barretti TaxID=519541 RepID=A0AA35TTD1_GEOBA|nr:hypothetical protein GBAR_LOCUS28854 [Geodia barretti]